MGGAIGTAIKGGAVLSSAAAAVQQNSQDEKYYRSLAQAAEENAKRTQEAAKRNVQYVFEDAGYQQRQVNKNYASAIGKQKVSLAASGVGADSATAQMILRNSRLNAQLDQEMLVKNMNRSIYEINTEAAFEAQAYREQSRQYYNASKSQNKWWTAWNSVIQNLSRM